MSDFIHRPNITPVVTPAVNLAHQTAWFFERVPYWRLSGTLGNLVIPASSGGKTGPVHFVTYFGF
ncbi:MAG: hypothetical protein WC451_02220 [Patescibacteria group bacterium]